jgi:hypothetical protein
MLRAPKLCKTRLRILLFFTSAIFNVIPNTTTAFPSSNCQFSTGRGGVSCAHCAYSLSSFSLTMPKQLPSNDRMRSYIEKRVRSAKDLSLLSRSSLKDGLAKEFHMTDEQRAHLDTDKHYKGLIKTWIQETIVCLSQPHVHFFFLVP